MKAAEDLVLGRELGRGGQAEVFEAEHRGRRVAVKVLLTNEPEREKMFLAECELVRRVHHAAVVPIHEIIRTKDGRLACTMELVQGSTLLDLVRRGEVPSTRAVAVVASAARALAAVHEAGIIHRDVKPNNILVEPGGRVRILDFGIARAIDAPASGDVAGTPCYLAPEQVLGVATGPATDVWALGVVLYELLTGTLPYMQATLATLFQAIVHDAPPAPRGKNPAIGPATEAVVLRCLAKDPSERFDSAKSLAEVLEKLLGGSSVEEALAPVIVRRLSDAPEPAEPESQEPPLPSKERARVHHRWSWEFDAPVAKLWEVVSDTEKFNKAAGLPPVVLRDRPDGKGGVERIGTMTWMGREIEWVENPFEWVAPERLSIVRTYTKGPLEALWSEVTLTPRPDGGSSLVHDLRMQPRGALGRIAAALEVRLRSRKAIDAVYKRLAETARRKEPLAVEVARTPLAPSGAERLEKGFAKIAAADKRAAAVIPRLDQWLRNAPDSDVTRLRPYELARRWDFERREVVHLFALAAIEGILEVSWHLLCTVCRVPARSLATLASLRAKAHCEACGIAYDNDFSKNVEMVFRPRPEVRAIGFDSYCKGGPGFFPHVALQLSLEPGETRSTPVALEPGAWRVLLKDQRGAYDFRVEAGASDSAVSVTIERGTVKPGPEVLAAGLVGFTFTNATRRRRVVRIESAKWREDALTALEACGIAALRKLPAAASPGEPIKIANGTCLAVHGVRRERLVDSVEEAGGAVTPDRDLAAFQSPSAAMSTAFRLAKEGGRAALHVGPLIVSTLGDGLGFDGPAPRIASELLADTQAGEVAATHLVLGGPGVAPLIGPRETRAQERKVGEDAFLGVVYLKAADVLPKLGPESR